MCYRRFDLISDSRYTSWPRIRKTRRGASLLPNGDRRRWRDAESVCGRPGDVSSCMQTHDNEPNRIGPYSDTTPYMPEGQPGKSKSLESNGKVAGVLR
jgi:hypothetical protein